MTAGKTERLWDLMCMYASIRDQKDALWSYSCSLRRRMTEIIFDDELNDEYWRLSELHKDCLEQFSALRKAQDDVFEKLKKHKYWSHHDFIGELSLRLSW